MNGLQNNPLGSTLWQASLPQGILTNPFVRQGSSPRLPVCKHPAEEEPMSADNKSIVRLLYDEVWNKRRLELVDEIISPSHALHDPNLTGSAVGPEAYKRLVSRWVAGISDLRFTLEDMVGENEKLAVPWSRAASPAFLPSATRLKRWWAKMKGGPAPELFRAHTKPNSWAFPPLTKK